MLMVLEVIADQPQSVGRSDLAERIGMTRQALHRILDQLQDIGMVVRVPNRDRYAIGARFSKLALAAMCSANKGFPIRAVIQQLVAALDETVNLGTLSGSEFVYLERVECSRSPRIYLETGGRLPAHVTSGGKSMMAFLPPDTREQLLKTMGLARFTPNTITRMKAFRAELDAIAKRGYATANQEYAEGIIGIGVPVLGADGFAVAALAMHAPIARVPIDKARGYADKLAKAAKRLARAWDEGV